MNQILIVFGNITFEGTTALIHSLTGIVIADRTEAITIAEDLCNQLIAYVIPEFWTGNIVWEDSTGYGYGLYNTFGLYNNENQKELEFVSQYWFEDLLLGNVIVQFDGSKKFCRFNFVRNSEVVITSWLNVCSDPNYSTPLPSGIGNIYDWVYFENHNYALSEFKPY